MEKIDLFGIKIDNVSMAEALRRVDDSIGKKKRKMYFVNADCFNKMHINERYYIVVKSGDVVFGDGSGVKLAGRITGQPVKDNINGTDMLPELVKLCVENKYGIFLLGGKAGVAEKMKENLIKTYPELRICGTHHGYFDRNSESGKIINIINRSGADIILVAFGAPFQEIWIDENMNALNCSVAMGVGGLFDFFSGNMPRAPKWMRKLGVEWIFRLKMEPGRMWRRYIIGNPVFIGRVFIWMFSGRRSLHDRSEY